MAIGFGSLAPLARNMLAMLDGEITTSRQRTAQFVTRVTPESASKPPSPLKSAVDTEPPVIAEARVKAQAEIQAAGAGEKTAPAKLRGGQLDIRI